MYFRQNGVEMDVSNKTISLSQKETFIFKCFLDITNTLGLNHNSKYKEGQITNFSYFVNSNPLEMDYNGYGSYSCNNEKQTKINLECLSSDRSMIVYPTTVTLECIPEKISPFGIFISPVFLIHFVPLVLMLLVYTIYLFHKFYVHQC